MDPGTIVLEAPPQVPNLTMMSGPSTIAQVSRTKKSIMERPMPIAQMDIRTLLKVPGQHTEIPHIHGGKDRHTCYTLYMEMCIDTHAYTYSNIDTDANDIQTYKHTSDGGELSSTGVSELLFLEILGDLLGSRPAAHCEHTIRNWQ
jgi:hypothetical protein